MHLHILGICGTFMGGLAALARAAGHQVTGSDANVYPPMSTQLRSLGIDLVEGYEAGQLDPAPDVVVVGNVMRRGLPVIERLLDSGLPYVSGPQWLAEHVLRGREVVAIAGTHGKTTTSSLLAWILEHAGQDPGFLIGGLPGNFGTSARLGSGPFVIEADEYDTAFFDKRAKFVHYRPRHVVLNNLEYDHADIYPDLASIQRQCHHLIRMVPGSGRVICKAGDAALSEVLEMGCWTPITRFGADGEWQARLQVADGSQFEVLLQGQVAGQVRWDLIGQHNVDNALAAIVAASGLGVNPAAATAALKEFVGVRRRMELRGQVNGIAIYDDFAHHPTAIASTIAGLRHRVGDARIVAILEPRSNTMRLGVHGEALAQSLAGADRVWLYRPADLGWDPAAQLSGLGDRLNSSADISELVARLAQELQSGDHALVMSNGGFGGLHEKLIMALKDRTAA